MIFFFFFRAGNCMKCCIALSPSLGWCVPALYFVSTSMLCLPSFSTLHISSVDSCVPDCCPLCQSIPHSLFLFLLPFFTFEMRTDCLGITLGINVTSAFKRRPLPPTTQCIVTLSNLCRCVFFVVTHSPLLWRSCINIHADTFPPKPTAAVLHLGNGRGLLLQPAILWVLKQTNTMQTLPTTVISNLISWTLVAGKICLSMLKPISLKALYWFINNV